MATLPSFSAMCSKGDNFCYFLFVYLEDKVFPKWDLLLRGIFLMGANSFLHKMIKIDMVGNNENDRVASPESVPIHLKLNVPLPDHPRYC